MEKIVELIGSPASIESLKNAVIALSLVVEAQAAEIQALKGSPKPSPEGAAA